MGFFRNCTHCMTWHFSHPLIASLRIIILFWLIDFAFFEIWIHFIIFKIMCVFLFFLIHVSHHFELSDTFAPLILLSFLFYTLLYVSHTSHHFALTGTLVLLIFLSQTQYIYFILNPHSLHKARIIGIIRMYHG